MTKSAARGDTKISVSSGLDWQTGDKIGLLPTGKKHFESDYAVIQSYDAVTGLVTLDRPLDYYHFGSATSTAQKYSGVDIRGEVVLLTRSV